LEEEGALALELPSAVPVASAVCAASARFLRFGFAGASSACASAGASRLASGPSSGDSCTSQPMLADSIKRVRTHRRPSGGDSTNDVFMVRVRSAGQGASPAPTNKTHRLDSTNVQRSGLRIKADDDRDLHPKVRRPARKGFRSRAGNRSPERIQAAFRWARSGPSRPRKRSTVLQARHLSHAQDTVDGMTAG
jgi:hypothetical protein